MIDELLDQCIGKLVDYVENEDNAKRLESKILAPLMKHMTQKFAWLAYSFQTVAVLVVLQTLLILYLVFRVHSRSTCAMCSASRASI